jgi:hypothetical protein
VCGQDTFTGKSFQNLKFLREFETENGVDTVRTGQRVTSSGRVMG